MRPILPMIPCLKRGLVKGLLTTFGSNQTPGPLFGLVTINALKTTETLQSSRNRWMRLCTRAQHSIVCIHIYTTARFDVQSRIIRLVASY